MKRRRPVQQITMDRDLRAELIAWCVAQDLTVAQAIEALVADLLEAEGVPLVRLGAIGRARHLARQARAARLRR